MIAALGRDALLALLALAFLVYAGDILVGEPVTPQPVALLLGVAVAALAAIGYDRVRTAAETAGEGWAAWLAAREVAVGLALLGFVLLVRVLTVVRPPPAHVEAGVLWFVTGLAGATLLLAVGASIRRAVSG